ncbi:MAG: DNA polymerase III subunit delta', partial [Nocardioidaceae bacterium]
MSTGTSAGAGPAVAPGVGSVWSSLVGQRHVIDVLRRAVAGQGMTHAWLFTGPPGSGRSNAAVAFAAALQCERGVGCGEC